MPRKFNKKDGFFIGNSMPFKDTKSFEKNAMSVNEAEDFLNKNPNAELKFMVPEGYILIDADEAKDEKLSADDPKNYIQGQNALHKISPYSYETSNSNKRHFGYKVRPEHQALVDTFKLNSSAGKIYSGVDTRGARGDGKAIIQGAAYLNANGKKRGGRPTPQELIEGLKTTPYAPLGLLVPQELRPVLKSGQDGERTSFGLAIKFKKHQLEEKYFLEYCAEQAKVGREANDVGRCKNQGAKSPSPSVVLEHTGDKVFNPNKDVVGIKLYRFEEDFFIIGHDQRFVEIKPGDLEAMIYATPRWVKDKETKKMVPKPGTRAMVQEEMGQRKASALKLEVDQNKIAFLNRTYDLNTRTIIEETTLHRNKIPGRLRDLKTFSSDVKKMHHEYMTSILGEWKANADKGVGIYLDIAFAMAPRLFTESLRVYYGTAGNGKSKLIEFIGRIVGEDNITAIDFQTLSKDSHASSSLVHKTVNLVGDMNPNYNNEMDLLKRLTAGDPIMINGKGKQPYAMKPYAYNIGALNKIPLGTDDDGSGALLRRLKFTHFKMIVVRDLYFNEKYMTDDHIELFVAMAVQVLTKYLEPGSTLQEGQEPDLLEEGRINTDHIYRYYKHTSGGGSYDHYVEGSTQNGLTHKISRFRFDDKGEDMKGEKK